MPVIFLSRHPMVLASPTSWGLHWNLVFIFKDSCSRLRVFLQEIPGATHIAYPQHLLETIIWDIPCAPHILYLPCLQNQYHIIDTAKSCSQLRMEPGHTEPELCQPSCASPRKTLPLRVIFNGEPFPQHPPWAASFWGIHIFTRWLLRWAVPPSRCLLSCSSAA